MPDTNPLGLTKADYAGAKSTLCLGCGHDQITRHIITATFESGVDPYMVAKTSGIGCSSKTPAYFINRAYGINSVHGRMPSVATGAGAANRHLVTIGVSGDGDTSNIGLGQFMHAARRNLNMVYVVENNGVYGLTKGQFSATAEKGATLKKGDVNEFADVDLCEMALELGCSFVARTFSGDGKQVVGLLRAAIAHEGFALLDVISPCVTFNNLDSSKKGFGWMREHNLQLHEVGYVAPYEAVEVDMEPGSDRLVDMPDGGHIMLHKLAEDHDPTDITAARRVLERDRLDEGHVYTGLIYCNEKASRPLQDALALPGTPLAHLGEAELRPSEAAFDELVESYC